MLNHETRAYHFFIPLLMAIIGGIFAHIDTWEYVGWIIWAVAGATIYFLLYTVFKDKELDRIKEEHEHYATIITLDAAHKTTKLVINKTEIMGNGLSLTFAEIRVPPAKMKIFAIKVLDGAPLTIRDWTPVKDGKVFTSDEWRRLIQFMKAPVADRPDIKFVEQVSAKDERKGFRLTDAGRKWLENIADAYQLTPSLTN